MDKISSVGRLRLSEVQIGDAKGDIWYLVRSCPFASLAEGLRQGVGAFVRSLDFPSERKRDATRLFARRVAACNVVGDDAMMADRYPSQTCAVRQKRDTGASACVR